MGRPALPRGCRSVARVMGRPSKPARGVFCVSRGTVTWGYERWKTETAFGETSGRKSSKAPECCITHQASLRVGTGTYISWVYLSAEVGPRCINFFGMLDTAEYLCICWYDEWEEIDPCTVGMLTGCSIHLLQNPSPVPLASQHTPEFNWVQLWKVRKMLGAILCPL